MEREKISTTVTKLIGYVEPQVTDEKLHDILGPKYRASKMSSLVKLEWSRRRVNTGYDSSRITDTQENLSIAFKGLLVAAVRTGQPYIEMNIPFLEQEQEDYKTALDTLADHLRLLGYLPVISLATVNVGVEEPLNAINAYRLEVGIHDKIE